MSDLTKEMMAAYKYVESIRDTADDKFNIMWHGWALREAFVAGANWQSAQQSVQLTDGGHAESDDESNPATIGN